MHSNTTEFDRVSSRPILGENVSQAAQFAESGNAQARLTALSDAFSPALNLAALSRLIQPNAARKSLEFMHGAESTSLLKKGGFSPPAEKP